MISEDLSVYFSDWGEAALLDGAPVSVVYGGPGAVAFEGSGMASDKPRALIASASIPARTGAPDADQVLAFPAATALHEKRYFVRDLLPDGTGMTTLVLAKHDNQA